MNSKFHKRVLCALLLIVCSGFVVQAYRQVTVKFEPLSYEEIVMYAQAQAARREYEKKRFEEFQEKAYSLYNRGDLLGFLTYSNYALETGWYNAKLYYDRGCAYEKLNDFKKAKKEYKKAKKHGYVYAESALQSLKIHEQEYKHVQKIEKQLQKKQKKH